MPDNIRLFASGASGVYLGTVVTPDVDWGAEVIARQYNESVNAYGGAFAYTNAGLRRIVMPFIFAGTGPDQTTQFVESVQGQIVFGGGAQLDVQMENASWLTRFDVVGGQIIPERDIRYHRAGVLRGRIELETIPFGYTPTTMIAASVASFNLNVPTWAGFVMPASVIGDVAGPMQMIIGGTAATSGASYWAAAPYGFYVGLREGATVPGVVATYLNPGAGVGASVGVVLSAATMTGFMTPAGATVFALYNNASWYTCLATTGAPTAQVIAAYYGPTAAQMGVPERRRALTNIGMHASMATLTLYLWEFYSNRILSKRVAVPPGGPAAVGYRGRMVDFGEIVLDNYIFPNLVYVLGDLSDRSVWASTPSINASTPLAVIDLQLILSPADDALLVVPTALGPPVNFTPQRQSGFLTNTGSFNQVSYAINATSAVDLASYVASTPSAFKFNIDPIVRGARPFWPPNPSGVPHSIHVIPISSPDWIAQGALGTTASMPTAPMIMASGVFSISVTYQPRWLFVR